MVKRLFVLVLVAGVAPAIALAQDNYTDSSVNIDVRTDVRPVQIDVKTKVNTDLRPVEDKQRETTLEAQREKLRAEAEARRAAAENRGDKTQSRHEALRIELENRRAEMDARREAKREEAEARRAEVKANIEERRVELVRDVVDRKLANVVRVMLATIERLENIASRIDSRIEKIKLRGGNTSESERYLTEAKTNLSDARASVATIASLELFDETIKENFERMRALANEVRGHLRSAHTNLMLSVRNLSSVESNVEASSSVEAEAE